MPPFCFLNWAPGVGMKRSWKEKPAVDSGRSADSFHRSTAPVCSPVEPLSWELGLPLAAKTTAGSPVMGPPPLHRAPRRPAGWELGSPLQEITLDPVDAQPC